MFNVIATITDVEKRPHITYGVESKDKNIKIFDISTNETKIKEFVVLLNAKNIQTKSSVIDEVECFFYA